MAKDLCSAATQQLPHHQDSALDSPQVLVALLPPLYLDKPALEVFLDSSLHLAVVCLALLQATRQAPPPVDCFLVAWEANPVKMLPTRTRLVLQCPLEVLGSLPRQGAVACLETLEPRALILGSPHLGSRSLLGHFLQEVEVLHLKALVLFHLQQNHQVALVVHQYLGVLLHLVLPLPLAAQRLLGQALLSAVLWDQRVVKCLEKEQLLPVWEVLALALLPMPLHLEH